MPRQKMRTGFYMCASQYKKSWVDQRTSKCKTKQPQQWEDALLAYIFCVSKVSFSICPNVCNRN